MLYLLITMGIGFAVIFSYKNISPSDIVFRSSVRSLFFFIITSFWLHFFIHITNPEKKFNPDALFDAAGVLLIFLWLFNTYKIKKNTLLIWLVSFFLSGIFLVLSESTLFSILFFIQSALALTTFWLCSAMIKKKSALLRTILHSTITLAMMAFGFPFLLCYFFNVWNKIGSYNASHLGAAIFLTVSSFIIFISAAFQIIRTGGTPDPWDPPLAYIKTGIYTYMKHPMQWAQVGLVIASAFIFSHKFIWIYALVFSLMLLGPYRWLEMILLKERFSEIIEKNN